MVEQKRAILIFQLFVVDFAVFGFALAKQRELFPVRADAFELFPASVKRLNAPLFAVLDPSTWARWCF